MDPFSPIFLLVLGTVAILVGRPRSVRVSGVTALATAFFAAGVMLMLGFRLPTAVALSRWQTDSLFGGALRLTADGASWLLALALLLALFSTCLIGLSSRTKRAGRHRGGSLLVVACALVAVFADNLMTLAIAWAALDLVTFFSLALARGEKWVAAEFTIGLFAVALVLAAALVGVQAGVPPGLGGGEPPAQGGLFLVLATMLRLGLYPVHVGARRILGSRWGQIESITRLASIAVAVDLLAVLALQTQVIPLRGWLTLAALAGGLVGGWKWYSASTPREQLTHMLLAQTGVIVLTFLWGGQWAEAGVIAQGLSVLLAGTVLSLFRGDVATGRSGAFSPAVAALVLGGLPVTEGFVGTLAVYSGLLQAGIWALALPIVVVVQALLIAGALRLAFFPGQGPPQQAPFAKTGYLLGLAMPAATGVLAGLSPDRLAALLGAAEFPGWAAMLAPEGFTALGSALLAGGIGIGLWQFWEQLQVKRAAIPHLALVSALELRWLHASLRTMYRGLARAMHAAALVLEGQGGVLWALVLVTVVWLALEG